MYNQLFIDSIGEKKFDNIINGKQKYIFDINNQKIDNKIIYFVFQHYLIKCLSSTKNINNCKQYITNYYKDLANKPWEFVNSPLLNNKVINMIFGNTPTSKKIFE